MKLIEFECNVSLLADKFCFWGKDAELKSFSLSPSTVVCPLTEHCLHSLTVSSETSGKPPKT